MRILHADTDDLENPLRGGQPVRTFEVNTRLAKNHEITVFTASYQNSVKHVVKNNISYERLGVTVPMWGLSSHLSFLASLPTAIKRKPHDLVIEEFTPPFGFCGLEKNTDKPVISMVQWFFFNDWQKRYKLPFENIMRARAKKNPARNIIVQTNKMGEYFKDLIPQASIYKIPCGINQQAFDEAEVTGEYALFLGRLDTQHKGLDDLLEAWFLIKTHGIRIPLWIVGAGKDELALRAKVLQLGLSNEIHFKGRLEGEAKKIALKNCRFLVMPSRQETFGITALEAMAVKKPVIAYEIDHLNELLKPQWSSAVKVNDVSSLATAITDLWQQPEKCIVMGNAGLLEAKKYSWDEVARAQEDVYLNVIRKI